MRLPRNERKKFIMHGEFRYRRTDDDRPSDMCRIGWEWPSSDAACIITWYNIGKTWSASQGDVPAWRLGGIRFKPPCMFYSHKLPFDGAAEGAVHLIRRDTS